MTAVRVCSPGSTGLGHERDQLSGPLPTGHGEPDLLGGGKPDDGTALMVVPGMHRQADGLRWVQVRVGTAGRIEHRPQHPADGVEGSGDRLLLGVDPQVTTTRSGVPLPSPVPVTSMVSSRESMTRG